MMTLHAAKGLEFPVVFLLGLEEGVFPHSRSLDDFDQLEEERRLCYVGMTRGMEKLYITRAQRRMLFNNTNFNPPARFLDDLPADVIKTGEKERQTKRFVDDWDDEEFGFAPAKQRPGYGHSDSRPGFGAGSAYGPKKLGASSGARPAAKKQAGPRDAGASPPAQPKPAIVIAVGDKVEHAHFGMGTVIAVSDNKATASVDFGGRGVKQLAVSLAPMKVVDG